jgi:hypothetical protein
MTIRALPVALCILAGGALAEAPPGTRLLSALDVSVFSCAPNPAHRILSSEADVARTLDELRPHCEAEVFRAREAAFRKGLKAAGVTWGEETVVVVQDWYGTGMAKASLRLSLASKDRLDASVVWKVPPPPVTPDTATCRFAFAVRNRTVREVAVTAANSGSRTFQIPP